MTDRNTLIKEWHTAKQALDIGKANLQPLVDREMELRLQVQKELFPQPVEGAKNQLELGNGYKLKLTHKIHRKVDPESLAVCAEKLEELGVAVSMLYRVKYDLDSTIYRKLNAEQASAVQETFTETYATPTVELIEPKK